MINGILTAVVELDRLEKYDAIKCQNYFDDYRQKKVRIVWLQHPKLFFFK